MEKGLIEKTGHDLTYWIDVVKTTQLDKHKAIVEFLKTEHGFTYGYANFVALKTLKSDAASHDADMLVENQYSGKQALIPIYQQLHSIISGFGQDVVFTPKKDSVSCIRKKQFALIKPATKTRVDLGLKIKNEPFTQRLESSGPFGAMCTHRVRITQLEEVDDELVCWLKKAYEKAL